MTLDEMIAVLQAAKDGKTIQGREKRTNDVFVDLLDPYCNFDDFEFRVKPEPVVMGLKIELLEDGRSWTAHISKSQANLELEFIDDKLVGAKVL